MNLGKSAFLCVLITIVACAAGGCGKREKPIEVDPAALEAALDGQELELEDEIIRMARDNAQRFKVKEAERLPDSSRVCVVVQFEYFDRGKTLAVGGTINYEETAAGMKDARFETSEVKAE